MDNRATPLTSIPTNGFFGARALFARHLSFCSSVLQSVGPPPSPGLPPATTTGEVEVTVYGDALDEDHEVVWVDLVDVTPAEAALGMVAR